MSELRTNKIYPRDGLPAGASGGGIIQVVQSKFTSELSTSVTSTWIQAHTISITPSSASNKIIVMWNGEVYGGGVDTLRAEGRLVRSPSTVIWYSSDIFFRESGGQLKAMCNSAFVVDSPATTSQVTYAFDALISSGDELFLDEDANWLTLMEVSG